MNRVVEPLKQFKDYSEEIKHSNAGANKKAVIYFLDEDFKPLLINRTKVASCEELVSFKNHIEYLPRVGDMILVNDCNIWKVRNVIHSLPFLRSEVQKIFIILEKNKEN